MSDERWTDTLAPTAVKLLMGMVLGAGLAVGYAIIADNANAMRIEALAADTTEWRKGVIDRLSSIELQMGIFADRQVRIQEDVAEIKRAQKGGGEPSE